MKDKFFTKLDWASFWTATIITFAVYFFTLGPSVGLEDSGELATAAAHLGVPHPPGYPFWTLCSWVFCKLFSWVTYMGYPTPAWAVSLCSAVFGAFAAGFTAMLICRSGRDFIRGKNDDYDCVCGKGYDFDSECLNDAGRISRPFSSFSAPLCFGGGVGGGVKVSPIAFLIVKDGNVRMMPVASAPSTTSERIVEMVPDLLDKVSAFLDKKNAENAE